MKDQLEKLRALVIEDDGDVRAIVEHALINDGYDVRSASTGELGLREVKTFVPQIVLLDLMLPDITGIEVCRRIRSDGDAKQPAILILTARSEEIDRVVGFEVGADDYIVKPFSLRELLLRVRARLHPVGAAASNGARPHDLADRPKRGFVIGPMRIDLDTHRLTVNNADIPVTALEMRLLAHLARSEGKVCSRKHLLTHVWDYAPEVPSRTVDTHVKRLREKLGPAGVLIQTVRGLGYRLSDPYEAKRRS